MSQKELDAMTDKVLAYNPNQKATPLTVVAGAADKPLVLGNVEIPCYVLDDETRVLTQTGLFDAIGASRGGNEFGAEIPRFATQNWIKPYINNELSSVLKSPISFHPPVGAPAYGYPATILADICMAIIRANADGKTTERQKGMVERAILLHGGFGHVGIIALVDEATGYERVREERALAKILEAYIADEPQVWSKTFPLEFYQHICRLRGWEDFRSIKRPKQMGKDTNDIIYERLAPGVLDELRKANPVLSDDGYRRRKHFQWLTPEHGHPKLRERLEGVMAIMRLSKTWNGFKQNLDRVYPKTGVYQPPRKKPRATLEKFFPKKE